MRDVKGVMRDGEGAMRDVEGAVRIVGDDGNNTDFVLIVGSEAMERMSSTSRLLGEYSSTPANFPVDGTRS